MVSLDTFLQDKLVKFAFRKAHDFLFIENDTDKIYRNFNRIKIIGED